MGSCVTDKLDLMDLDKCVNLFFYAILIETLMYCQDDTTGPMGGKGNSEDIHHNVLNINSLTSHPKRKHDDTEMNKEVIIKLIPEFNYQFHYKIIQGPTFSY